MELAPSWLHRIGLTLLIAAGMLFGGAPLPWTQEAATTATSPPPTAFQPTDSEKLFLDRLMMAESAGQDDARNPRSSALGPYQFIGSTFLDVMGRYFPALIDGKSDAEVLRLRTNQAIARDAALVYTRENAAFLLDRGLEANSAPSSPCISRRSDRRAACDRGAERDASRPASERGGIGSQSFPARHDGR